MGDLIDGDDGIPAEVVGAWAKEKQEHLCRYIDISRGVRAKYIQPAGKGGACYIDLFCGPGRSLIRDTDEWIDGSPVAAWKKSCAGGAPFSKIIISDLDPVRVDAAEKRLSKLGAPVVALQGDASTTAFKALQRSATYGLNFAFLDPYSIEALDFQIFQTLARIKRIDILAHVSKMDLQRNLPGQLADDEAQQFDSFAPGWRDMIDRNQPTAAIRREIFEYWRGLVADTGIATSEDTQLITGSKGQHLYWLLLAAKHELAHKFWKTSSKGAQGSLF